MIYEVTGLMYSKHSCNCEYCERGNETIEVSEIVVADSENMAIGRVFNQQKRFLDNPFWSDTPSVREVDVPLDTDLGGRAMPTWGDFISDGKIAVRRDAVTLPDDVETRTITPPDFFSNRPTFPLYPDQDASPDKSSVKFFPGNLEGGEVILSKIYVEYINKRGYEVYSLFDPVNPVMPVALLKDGDVVGYVMPMAFER